MLLKVASCITVALLLATGAPAAMLETGDDFPSWTLADHTGKSVSSDELSGKRYVIWFYPKAMTPGCTVEGQAFGASFAAYQERDVEIFGVSFDKPADNARFVEAENFPFRLLSDSERKLGMAVGAASSANQGYAKRISYLVGADGKVLQAYGSVNPQAHAGEVLKDLD